MGFSLENEQTLIPEISFIRVLKDWKFVPKKEALGKRVMDLIDQNFLEARRSETVDMSPRNIALYLDHGITPKRFDQTNKNKDRTEPKPSDETLNTVLETMVQCQLFPKEIRAAVNDFINHKPIQAGMIKDLDSQWFIGPILNDNTKKLQGRASEFYLVFYPKGRFNKPEPNHISKRS